VTLSLDPPVAGPRVPSTVPTPPAVAHAGGAVLRPVAPSDGPAVRALFERCSAESLYHRFHSPVAGAPEVYVRDLLSGRAGHDALVAVVDDAVVGIGSGCTVTTPLIATGDAADERFDLVRTEQVELGLLVEDGWQRRGIGTALAAALVARARRRGVSRIVAEVLGGDRHVLAMLVGQLPSARSTVESGVVVVTADLPPQPARRSPGAPR
jgi:GNAT superfamily N-acetyltransferase